VGFNQRDWVEVSGQIQFRQSDKGEYIPVLQLRSRADIRKTDPGNSLYE
jgi:uncharacterized membrane protein YcgQ (UPF0703/DUF1980 family)